MSMILIRHGESLAVHHPELWKVPSNFAVGLSAEGVQQTVRLAHTLNHLFNTLPNSLLNNAKVYVSTMVRATQTYALCKSLCAFRTKDGGHPLENVQGYGPDLNEFLSWKHPKNIHNPYTTPNAGDPYELWLKDKNSDQPNIRSWEEMRGSILLHRSFLESMVDPGTLTIVFAHHYPINAILAESTEGFSQNEESLDTNLIRHIPIPNAVPVLLGFPYITRFPDCLIGEELIAESQQSLSVSA